MTGLVKAMTYCTDWLSAAFVLASDGDAIRQRITRAWWPTVATSFANSSSVTSRDRAIAFSR